MCGAVKCQKSFFLLRVLLLLFQAPSFLKSFPLLSLALETVDFHFFFFFNLVRTPVFKTSR